MTRISDVDQGWTVRAVGGDIPAHLVGVSVPATVPGCVHLDLLAAGLIPDPYLDENERLVAWIGRVDWRYETTLRWDPSDAGLEVDLVALGLDTVATVEVNGTVLGHTRNMHRGYRFPVGTVLRPGDNALAITFEGGLSAAERASRELGERPHVNPHPYNAVRKMACDYGWDWGPRLATVGIWRELRLHTWSGARIDTVRPLVFVRGRDGLVRVHVLLRRTPNTSGPLRLEVAVGDARVPATLAAGQSTAVIEVPVSDVRLWWPRGYGEQPRYDVSVQLLADRVVLDQWHGRIGFRTVELDTTPDPDGTPFTLIVNGQPVFARGVNWIPDDCFPSRVDRARYAQRLGQACDAGVNLVRVWGGGIYESEDFYDLCDERGLLVWQDFLFACASYAEEEPLLGEVVAEAREAVTRLSPHPSLVLWNGGNENIWGYHDWGWPEQLEGRSWGWRYYTEIFPAILAELDPTRPYSPGSPYSFDPSRHPNLPEHGTVHIWDVWNEKDYTDYRRYQPRFVAEFGFQAPPTWATLTRAIHDEPLAPDSPGVLFHQRADDGNRKLAAGLVGHLPTPTTFADWHWAGLLNQARAITLGVEHFRSLTPHCMGTVVWQLNDVWPVISWSAVDGDGRRKPMWYALRRSYRDRLLTIQPRGTGLAVVAVNDSGEPWRAEVPVRRYGLDGTVLAEVSIAVRVTARSAVSYPLPPAVAVPDSPASELIVAGTGTDRGYWHFVEDIAAALPRPRAYTRVEPTATGYRLTVTAETFIRDLTLLADRVAGDAEVDQALLTLLPGETVCFDIRTGATVAPEAFVDPLVLRSASQLAWTVDQPGIVTAGGEI